MKKRVKDDEPRQWQQTVADSTWRAAVRRRLMVWFRGAHRPLPWRESRDPYRVWISEIMLQQTQVATVEGYFRRFMDRFPDVAALAAADEQDVLKLWEGLGYYRRAQQLHRASRQIVAEHGDGFPRKFDDVLALPGIGRYTAGAICSIAFDDRRPILEANSRRVLARWVAMPGDVTRPSVEAQLWSVAEKLLPRKNVGVYNQAVMELGSLVCKPAAPRCDDCPVAPLCQTRRLGKTSEIPAAKAKTPITPVTELALVIRRDGDVLLRFRGPDERWSGMWDFPRAPLEAEAPAPREIHCQRLGAKVELGRPIGIIQYGVTRYRVTMRCYEGVIKNGRQCGQPAKNADPTRWVRLEELDRIALNVSGRKLARLIQRV